MGIIDTAQRQREHDAEIDKLNAGGGDTLESELESVKPIPDKYKDLTREQLVEMHQTTERNLSRLGHEVGQLRKQVLEPRKEVTPPKEVKVDDLLENPRDAIETVVKDSPLVKKLNDQLESFEQNQLKQSFEQSFPDWQKDTQNPEFFEWIQKSKSRTALAQAADTADYFAAQELWSLWKERQELTRASTEGKAREKAEKREQALKAGTLESGSGTSTESKKVFKRSEIRDLKTRALQGDRKAQSIVEDPQWQQEVQRAYAEGRAR